MALAHVGDLAVDDTAEGPGLTVVGGAELLAPRPDVGLATLPLVTATTAFRV